MLRNKADVILYILLKNGFRINGLQLYLYLNQRLMQNYK